MGPMPSIMHVCTSAPANVTALGVDITDGWALSNEILDALDQVEEGLAETHIRVAGAGLIAAALSVEV